MTERTIKAFVLKTAHVKNNSVLNCWYHWIILHKIYVMMERDTIKDYIPVKTEENIVSHKNSVCH
jgi:hypothetical protein